MNCIIDILKLYEKHKIVIIYKKGEHCSNLPLILS